MDLARSTVKIFLGNVGSVVVTFAGIAFFARELGAAELGIFFLFQAILGFLVLPANIGIDTAIEKRISEGYDPGGTFSTGIVLKAGLLAVIVAAVLVASPVLNRYIGADLAGYLAVATVVQEAARLTMLVLRGELRVGESAIVEFSYSFIWIVVGAILVTSGYGTVGLVYAVIVGYLAQFLWGAYRVETSLGRPSRETARSLVDYGKFAAVPSVDGYVHGWMDVLIIGFFLAPAAVGIYEVAWQVIAPVLLLTSAIGVTIFPQVSSWNAEGSIESIERLFTEIFTPAVAVTIPAFFGVVLLSEEILELIFGSEYAAGWLALIVLAAGKIPRAIRKIVGKTLLGIDRPDLVMRAAVLDIVANVVLNTVLIWQFGIVGAAMGTVLSMTIGMVLRTYYLSRLIRLRVRFDELAWCLCASVGMFAVLYAFLSVGEVETLVDLFGVVTLGVVTYGVLLVLNRSVRSQLRRQATKHLSSFR